jgi:hypothetical protein
MGTGEFAVLPFRALLGSEHSVVGVLTQPDRSGRGHHQHVNPVKEMAVACNVPVFQPERVNRPEMLDTLRSLKADVFIVAAYGQILKPALLALPPLAGHPGGGRMSREAEYWRSRAERLERERDEARREVCARVAYPDRTPQMEAKMRGWNCYDAQEQAMNRLSQLDEELGLI